ncbi:MAG: FHA domain-containing protein [Planctomycetota bacterium]
MDVRFVFKGSSGPRTHSKSLPVLVGRSDAPDIKLRIPKDSVSRRHCEFFRNESGQICIRDLESTNGTFVDGRQLEPRVATPVSSGTMIKLGNVGFRVEYQVGQAAPRSPHDSDTLPIGAATAVRDVEDLEPVGTEPDTTVAPTEPLEPTKPLEPAPPVFAAEEPAAAGDFNFLAGAEEPEPATDAWPVADDAPAGGGDADLKDFLKGLP